MATPTDTAAGRPSLLQRLFHVYDRAWRRRNNVQPFDEVLSLAIEPYRGPERTLEDGTHLRRGDPLGIIHFNHDGFSPDQNRIRAALQFRRQFSQSLERLADSLETNNTFQDIKAFYGETWIRPHGLKVGFIVEPLPRTWRTRLQHRYLRFLLWVQFPHLARRNRDTWLHAYWLTRRHLRRLPERLAENDSKSSANPVMPPPPCRPSLTGRLESDAATR